MRKGHRRYMEKHLHAHANPGNCVFLRFHLCFGPTKRLSALNVKFTWTQGAELTVGLCGFPCISHSSEGDLDLAFMETSHLQVWLGVSAIKLHHKQDKVREKSVSCGN